MSSEAAAAGIELIAVASRVGDAEIEQLASEVIENYTGDRPQEDPTYSWRRLTDRVSEEIRAL